MTKGETPSTFKLPAEMTDNESHLFNRWLINNAVIGSAVAVGLVAIVAIGPNPPKLYLYRPNRHGPTSAQLASLFCVMLRRIGCPRPALSSGVDILA